MHALIIAGNDDAAGLVEWMLIDELINIDTALTAADGIAKARQGASDVILLDPSLLDVPGPEFLQRLRHAEIKIPVVIVSDGDCVEDMSRGFGFGAEAYVTLPADTSEQVNVIYKAAGWTRKPPFIAKVGEFTFEFKRWLKIDGERVCLCDREMRIVELLIRRRGETISTKSLCEYLYGGTDDAPELKMIDLHVSRARKLICFQTQKRNLIEVVWGKGYRLADPSQWQDPC